MRYRCHVGYNHGGLVRAKMEGSGTLCEGGILVLYLSVYRQDNILLHLRLIGFGFGCYILVVWVELEWFHLGSV
jgi:hypothetical protein